MGTGRYEIPGFVLKNPRFIKNIEKLGTEIMEHSADAATSIQYVHEKFKKMIISKARNTAKVMAPKLKQKLALLQIDLKAVTNDTTLSIEAKKAEIGIIDQQIKQLLATIHLRSRTNAKATHRIEMESVTKYFMRHKSSVTLRDIMQNMKIPGSTQEIYTRKSEIMAELARDYHKDIQLDGIEPEEECKNAAAAVLRNIKNCLNNEKKEDLSLLLTEEDVQQALHCAPRHKSSGLDGIPTELWQKLEDRFRQEVSKFNVV